MNIAVGKSKISAAAKAAIEAANGRIEDTLQPDIALVVVPDAEMLGSGDEYAHIALPTDKTLYFKRAWHTQDCSIGLCGE